MASQPEVNSIASYFFETNLTHKFVQSYQDEISNNKEFQQKLLEFSSQEYDTCQGSEFLIKKMIETNKDYQFSEMKGKLFERFNTVLNELIKLPVANASHEVTP